jgi:hypothetical protein
VSARKRKTPKVTVRLQPSTSTEKVLESIYGPFCERCGDRRTRNPSRVCSPCLGKACCRFCKGAGWVVDRRDGFPTGCGPCGGTGRAEPERRPPEKKSGPYTRFKK